MAGETTKKTGEVVPEGRSMVYETLRKLLLAGLGTVVVAQDEMEHFIEKMVEKGEIAEKDARKLVKVVVDRRKEGAKKAEAEIDKRVEEALNRMNIPTKVDIDALSNKITALTKKVEELKKSSGS
ncbi:MAG: phasin family protein [Dehalococcoidia bacterium]|nr:phasin family protein [Dehalococcoidia bacterium]